MIGRGAGRSELPGVAACGDAHANALGGIEDRAAADRQDEVDALALAQLNAAAHHRNFRIWLHTAQLDKRQTRFKKAVLHPIEQAGGAGARPAEMHEHAVRANLLELGADILFDIASENDFGCGMDGEIQHSGVRPPFLL